MGTEEKQAESHKHEPGAKAESEEDVPSCHTCGVCGRSFPLLSSLSQHMRRHTREKPYKCPYCEHRTAQKGSLKAHIRSHKLGLLNRNVSEKELEAEQGQKRHADIADAAEFISTPDKAHNVNGKVKKKLTKKDKRKDGAEPGPFTCTICEQVFPQLLLLKTHIKRHHGSQDHGCRICGRRFRQAWFLQSHMRIHRAKAQLQGNKVNEPPATINGVLQDPASLTNKQCHYELCAGCGNFFQDQKTLRIHEKLHKLNQGFSQNSTHEAAADISDKNADKTLFLESLHLKCAEHKGRAEEKSVAKRIPELDPVCSYQAWQLATRGRLVEASEKCFGWEERLADAEVAYDTEKGEYVPLKQEKKRKQNDASNSCVKKRKCDSGLEPNIGNGKSGDKKVCQKERIVLNGLGHAFYEALQTKKIKEVHVSSKVTGEDKEGQKSYSCEHCDFHTAEATLLRSHQHTQHLGFSSKQSPVLNNVSRSGSKSSKYMDYLRSRSVLLSQPYWNICTYLPDQDTIKANVKVTGDGDVAADGVSLLNLSLSVSGDKCSMNCPVKAEDLVRHQCPYCSHNTNYPEVLWIHQRVSHKVDSKSSAAPKWAPCMNSLKSSKAGACQWRRTGPPPFLEGKDCPSLPGPRTQRTLPPGVTSQGSSKHSTTKSKPHLKESCPPDGIQPCGKVCLQPQKKSGEQKQATEGRGKGSIAQDTLSDSSSRAKSVPNLQPTSSLKHRGNMAPEEGIFPQEGLGFMLAKNHSGTSSNTDRHYTRRKSCEFSSGLKAPDLWSTMNMWRLSGGKTYLDPLLFAQGNSESTGERPANMDIFSLLKSYSPRDLAALYQHWGFIDPRLDPQAMMQLNGSFGNEVQSASEGSKQMNSHSSSSSSGSHHKGT
uniref:Zinc finger protein 516 n=1 Tax=Oryzias latipes TaxID=8090 RepID=A0A3P9JXP3_ORYLA